MDSAIKKLYLKRKKAHSEIIKCPERDIFFLKQLTMKKIVLEIKASEGGEDSKLVV